jgi:hypothetical protein
MRDPSAEHRFGIKNPEAYGPKQSPLLQGLFNRSNAYDAGVRTDETRQAAQEKRVQTNFNERNQKEPPSTTDDIRGFNAYLNFAELKFPPDEDGYSDPRAQSFAEKHFAAKSSLAQMTADANNVLYGPEAQAKDLFERHGDDREAVMREIQQSTRPKPNGKADMSPEEARAVMAAYLKFVPLNLNRPPVAPAEDQGSAAPKNYTEPYVNMWEAIKKIPGEAKKGAYAAPGTTKRVFGNLPSQLIDPFLNPYRKKR